MTERSRKDEEIKDAVRQRYAAAVTQAAGSCCGPAPAESTAGGSACCGAASPAGAQGTVAGMAGYDAAELRSLPGDAVAHSFGCGNPLAFAGVGEGQTVLDIGSGAGIDCFLAAEKVGPTGKVIGLDMTPEMVERARRNARQAGRTNVEFRLGEAEKMPVADASVDWVISNCVINLSPDKPAVFREIARVLRPGGRISISDIVAEELPEAIRSSHEAWSACLAGAISERAYVAGLTAAGLRAVRAASRVVYDAAQLEMLFGTSPCGCPGADAAAGARESAGKIWSARFEGVKGQPSAAAAEVTLDASRPDELPAVQALLRAADLPADVEACRDDLLVARHGATVVGCIGMERRDACALFRSLAVAPEYRGLGLAHRLYQALEARAVARGVTQACLLTATIQPLAERWGFRRVERCELPSALQDTSELRAACCATAHAMVKDLAAPAPRPACCGHT